MSMMDDDDDDYDDDDDDDDDDEGYVNVNAVCSWLFRIDIVLRFVIISY